MPTRPWVRARKVPHIWESGQECAPAAARPRCHVGPSVRSAPLATYTRSFERHLGMMLSAPSRDLCHVTSGGADRCSRGGGTKGRRLGRAEKVTHSVLAKSKERFLVFFLIDVNIFLRNTQFKLHCTGTALKLCQLHADNLAATPRRRNDRLAASFSP